ncbi:hypothetical protein I4U23_011395 [Adineta vaga]|nr:hypothetical protein I4U23_011395 [Adineta vaga]
MPIINTSHFYGGIITWRPYNNTPSGSTFTLIVRERWSWRRSFSVSYFCNDGSIAAQNPMIGQPATYMLCTSGNCTHWSNMSLLTYCTDYSIALDTSSGEYSQAFTVPINIAFSIYYSSSAWMNQLIVGGSTPWYVVSRINTALRPDGFINTSPIGMIVPIVYKAVNVQYIYTIPIFDYDTTDIIKCRWATSNTTVNINNYDECGGICNGVPGAVLIPYNLEDYYNSTSVTPMSSVPIQFLFYGYNLAAGCTTPPAIFGGRANGVCFNVPVGSSVTEYIIALTYCPGTSIVQFQTTSPVATYQITLNWIPTSAQFGPQFFCAIAIDNNQIASNQSCFTFMVDTEAIDIIRPAMPALILQDQTLFSIQTTKKPYRPMRTGVNIYFHDANTSTNVSTFDCSSAPEVTYKNDSILINFYSGTMDSWTLVLCVALAKQFCGAESGAIIDPTFWILDVLDPTTTTSTTTTTLPLLRHPQPALQQRLAAVQALQQHPLVPQHPLRAPQAPRPYPPQHPLLALPLLRHPRPALQQHPLVPQHPLRALQVPRPALQAPQRPLLALPLLRHPRPALQQHPLVPQHPLRALQVPRPALQAPQRPLLALPLLRHPRPALQQHPLVPQQALQAPQHPLRAPQAPRPALQAPQRPLLALPLLRHPRPALQQHPLVPQQALQAPQHPLRAPQAPRPALQAPQRPLLALPLLRHPRPALQQHPLVPQHPLRAPQAPRPALQQHPLVPQHPLRALQVPQQALQALPQHPLAPRLLRPPPPALQQRPAVVQALPQHPLVLRLPQHPRPALQALQQVLQQLRLALKQLLVLFQDEDLYIHSLIEFLCNTSLSFTVQWTILNCSLNCTNSIHLDPSIKTTLTDLSIPARTLSYGIYELILSVRTANFSNSTIASSVYVRIILSEIQANLIQYGTSMITRGREQDLEMNPGLYSINPDENIFNATDWNYEYYCRIYGLYDFPKLNDTLLTIDDTRNDPSNPSCLINRTNILFSNSIKSSTTLQSYSFQSNQTYQFMIRMTNRRSPSLQATGYLLVNIEDTHPHMVLMSCIIHTLCTPHVEFQLVNPTTQVALFSACQGNCTKLQNITWNIYYGQRNSSSNITQWILFNQKNNYEDIWFFGTNTSNFTATDDLFLGHPQIYLWRFETIYSFLTETSSSSLNFLINQPPYNGFCSIDSLNGTINTIFTISCSQWLDNDGIRDYALYVWTNNSLKKIIVAFSSESIFQVRLPAIDNQTSLLHLIVHIRDAFYCTTEFFLPTVHIHFDSISISNFFNQIQNSSNEIPNNPIVRLLASENQNIVGQLIISLSQDINQINNDIIDKAFSNGIPITSISVSSLEEQISHENSMLLNQTALEEYEKQVNIYANVREYLITSTSKLAITTANSVKLQATALAQLTSATNELTRTTLTIASDRCYQLTLALSSMSAQIPYEDVQMAATQLMECAANVLAAVNGPLQERTIVLDLDSTRARKFPDDYDTDVEFEWSNPNSFADGDDFSWETLDKNRNKYYQNQLANEIFNQNNKMITLLTSSLRNHLNIGQNFLINTSQVFMSVEKISIDSLSNKLIKQMDNAQIQFPDMIQFDQNNNSAILIRSILESLATVNQWKSSSKDTNLSRSVTLSLLDRNENEIFIQTNLSHPIEILIPRDPNLFIPEMIFQNVTSMNSISNKQLFSFHYINITNSLPRSTHFEIHPLNSSLSYLFIYKFDQIPQLNSSNKQIDGWKIFCPSTDFSDENLYTYYIDNQQSIDHTSIVIGLRELNSTEQQIICSNSSSITNPPIQDEPVIFTANYELRIYAACCYYRQQTDQWKFDGLIVGPLTNRFQTQCLSTHLTSFAGGFVVLPTPVNWSYVFANADFAKNKTIYLTIICVLVLYIVIVIYARYKDRKDIQKLGVTPLPDNDQFDEYFYEIIVFTGQRKGAGTKSNVRFVLSGDGDDTTIRTLSDPHREILQRGGVDAFVMAVPKSLGLLNCIRIWHDNTGKGSSSSWFLKYLIIHDLQTMEKFHFICQKWFAVEKDDGKIERILAVASEFEKQEYSYILAKSTYHSISDGHLWFSIFSRPPSNRFTRVQRCTCCFVLFIISMFLNIMYYDLSNEVKTKNTNQTASLSFGSLSINREQVTIGIIVEIFALIPSLLVVQLFRRLRSRRSYLSPLQETLSKLRPNWQTNVEKKKKNKCSLTFPWWFIFIAYGLCIMFVSVSILFIIARGIEFGDEKTQKWLISILSGFFSSILFTQPLKLLILAIIFACFCRKLNEDKEALEYLDHDSLELNFDEEYLHTSKNKKFQTLDYSNRLTEEEVIWARDQRVKELEMWSIIREILVYLCFLALLYLVLYSREQTDLSLQVNHLRKYFLNSRQNDNDYTKISTINDYWKWLEESFIKNLRAQQWYNGDSPRNLSGYINDKTIRLIGWATMRQLRIRSELCLNKQIQLICHNDFSYSNEDTHQWMKNNSNLAFQYQTSDQSNTYPYIGEHGIYPGGGYIYEFRGRLSEIQSNLSQLQQLKWIDQQTRAVIIQFTLYNPNVHLFISANFLFEMISTGGILTQSRFEPLDFYAFTSSFQLICNLFYMIMIIYLMWIEFRLFLKLKWKKYCQRFWSWIELSICICSWTSVGIYIWRYKECQRIGKLFRETNGYVYINLQMASYINNILIYLFGFCSFFGTIKFIKLCRFNQRICLFIQTLKYSTKELLSFFVMFNIVFTSFIALFYLLFVSQLSSCASIMKTIRMLFEMTLMKFDAQELTEAAPVLGPIAFALFILIVVFVCLSMFITIISDNFRCARENAENDNQVLLIFMIRRFQKFFGLIKTEEDERNEWIRSQYINPIEDFPKKIDQLMNVITRLYLSEKDGKLKL